MLADFWQQIRTTYPAFSKGPAMGPMAENFDLISTGPRVRLTVVNESSLYTFLSEDEHWRVQVQPNRFVVGWAQTDEAGPYPRYRKIRRRFQELYRIFTDVMDTEILKAHPPSWCATTYVNEIAHPKSKDPFHGPLEDILLLVRKPKSNTLPTVEDTTYRQRHLLRSNNGEPCGRFYINADPMWITENHIPGYRLTLRAVSRPDGKSAAAVLRCQDKGRDLIVRSFKDITTPAMHEQWGLQES